MKLKKVPEDFVCHWFRTSTWRRNYEEGPIPVRGSRFWPKTGAPNVCVPPEPDQPGRKKVTKADKKRKKGVNESPTKKAAKHKKRIMHCGICGVADHNSRFHKKDAPQVCLVVCGFKLFSLWVLFVDLTFFCFGFWFMVSICRH